MLSTPFMALPNSIIFDNELFSETMPISPYQWTFTTVLRFWTAIKTRSRGRLTRECSSPLFHLIFMWVKFFFLFWKIPQMRIRKLLQFLISGPGFIKFLISFQKLVTHWNEKDEELIWITIQYLKHFNIQYPYAIWSAYFWRLVK